MSTTTNTAAPVTAEKLAKTRELINQLLAKAENTPYPAEAETFQEHAERLMVRYGIERAQLDAEAGSRGEAREAMGEHVYTLRGTYKAGDVRGLYAVSLAFGNVTVFESRGRSEIRLHLIGAESDVAQTVRLFDALMIQAQTAMKVWWIRNGRGAHLLSEADRSKERRQFRLGFFSGAAERVREVYGAEVADAGAGTALVLADRKDRADTYARELHPNVRTGRTSKMHAGSYRAQAAGTAAGRSADVHTDRRMSAGERAAVGA